MTNFKQKISVNSATIIRILVIVAALTNQVLVVFGLSPIPFTSVEVEAGITAAFTVVATLWGTWKNNDATPEAQQGTAYMNRLKRQKKDAKKNVAKDAKKNSKGGRK